MSSPNLVPSGYQQVVFAAIEELGPDLQITAVAGSGKSTTLIELLKRLPAHVVEATLRSAFNKEIAGTLAARAARGASVRTNHALGFATLAEHFGGRAERWSPKVDPRKYRALTTRYRAAQPVPGGEIAIRDDGLQAQLAALRYGFTSRGQLKVESKEEMRDRGVPSPDRADALALAFAADRVPPGPYAEAGRARGGVAGLAGGRLPRGALNPCGARRSRRKAVGAFSGALSSGTFEHSLDDIQPVLFKVPHQVAEHHREILAQEQVHAQRRQPRLRRCNSLPEPGQRQVGDIDPGHLLKPGIPQHGPDLPLTAPPRALGG
jgi:hypothetical protein